MTTDGQEDDLTANGLFIGESIGSIYTYQIDGIYQIGDENIPAGFAPGVYKLANLGGDETITPQDDRTIIGRTEPAYSFGIRNNITYKNFSFSFFIKSVQGGSNSYLGLNDPFNSGALNTIGNAQNNNWYAGIDYWSPSNPNAIFKRPGIESPLGAERYFSRSFVRLQDIALSYNLGENAARKIGAQNVKIFVSGKNLFTWTDWKGWDPETGQGLSALTRDPENATTRAQNPGLRTVRQPLPLMKGFSVGLDISF